MNNTESAAEFCERANAILAEIDGIQTANNDAGDYLAYEYGGVFGVRLSDCRTSVDVDDWPTTTDDEIKTGAERWAKATA